MNKIKIVSNWINEELYLKSKSLYDKLPYDNIGVKGENGLYNYEFIKHIIENEKLYDFDWMIYIDEDCFITNLVELEALLKHQIENNYYCSGMPDGGVISHRFHNPLVINPFFMILNITKIREIYNTDNINKSVYDTDINKFIPYNLIKTNIIDDPKFKRTIADGYKPYGVIYDNFEPCYKFFFYLLRNNIKHLYLDAYDYSGDDVTTVLKNYNGVDFAYHTWFARNWLYDSANRKRILDVFDFCNSIKIDTTP